MMTYREYVKEMKAAAEKNGFTASVKEMEKLNHSYRGLMVMNPSGKSGIVLDLKDSYRQYEQGESLQALQEAMMSIIREKLSLAPGPEVFRKLDIRPENLIAEAVSTKKNADYLSHVPHRDICDLSIILRAEVEAGNESGTTVITDDLLAAKGCGMGRDELLSSALCGIKKHRPYRVRRMFDMLSSMGMADMPQTGCDDQLMVVTTEDGCMGAGVIGYPGFLTECANHFGSFFILPSSIHELLLVPAEKDMDRMDSLYQMVCEINATVVSESDFLSDNVYHFDADEGILTDYFGRTYHAC